MFSRVMRTPLGVKSGRPLGNPSTGWPATWRPKTATRALSVNVMAGDCCLGILGRGEETGLGEELGNCRMSGFGDWLSRTFGAPVLRIWIS